MQCAITNVCVSFHYMPSVDAPLEVPLSTSKTIANVVNACNIHLIQLLNNILFCQAQVQVQVR